MGAKEPTQISLMANFFAQSEALMNGKTSDEVRKDVWKDRKRYRKKIIAEI